MSVYMRAMSSVKRVNVEQWKAGMSLKVIYIRTQYKLYPPKGRTLKAYIERFNESIRRKQQ